MDSTILIAFAFLSGIFVTVIATKFLRKSTKESLQDDIEFLQFERDHREMLRESKIHRDRVAKRSVFSALFFLGVLIVLTLAIPSASFNEALIIYEGDVTTDGIYARYVLLGRVKILLWFFYTVYVFFLWNRYKNLSSYQKHLYKIDEKMIKVRKKLDKKK